MNDELDHGIDKELTFGPDGAGFCLSSVDDKDRPTGLEPGSKVAILHYKWWTHGPDGSRLNHACTPVIFEPQNVAYINVMWKNMGGYVRDQIRQAQKSLLKHAAKLEGK